MTESFSEEVLHGLSSSPKRLPSKYFYDDKGSKIFQEIMSMEEYYLTRCESEIFKLHARDIAKSAWKPGLEIVELGAGDGLKTKLLLQAFAQENLEVDYIPIDISGEALSQLSKRLKKELPNQSFIPKEGQYFDVLEQLLLESDKPRLILFLGSNIGNFAYQEALAFMKRIHRNLHTGDQVLIGIDAKKAPALILPAYSDKDGITARFNLNLLDRINRELGANFQTKKFRHYASYEPETGEVRSYLISQAEQEVYIEKLNKTFHFHQWENIHTEISKKYSDEELKKLADESHFEVRERYFDSQRFFSDSLLERVPDPNVN